MNNMIRELSTIFRFFRSQKTVFNVIIILEYKKSLKIPKGGNQNPYIEEEQTTQWSKEKVQKDKQQSTKHIYIYIAKERVTRTALKTGGELRCSGSVFQNKPVLQTHVFYTSMNISV